MVNEIKKIMIDHGWEEIPLKFSHMLSFKKNNIRANIYKTGTITFQSLLQKYDRGKIYKDLTIKELKEILKQF